MPRHVPQWTSSSAPSAATLPDGLAAVIDGALNVVEGGEWVAVSGSSGSITSAEIEDASDTGKALLTASSAPVALGVLGTVAVPTPAFGNSLRARAGSYVVNSFSWVAGGAAGSYENGDLVYDGERNELYRSAGGNYNFPPPAFGAYWEVVGSGMRLRGAWDAAATYKGGDVVQHGSGLYRATYESTGIAPGGAQRQYQPLGHIGVSGSLVNPTSPYMATVIANLGNTRSGVGVKQLRLQAASTWAAGGTLRIISVADWNARSAGTSMLDLPVVASGVLPATYAGGYAYVVLDEPLPAPIYYANRLVVLVDRPLRRYASATTKNLTVTDLYLISDPTAATPTTESSPQYVDVMCLAGVPYWELMFDSSLGS